MRGLETTKEEHMKRIYRYVGSFLLGVALIAPARITADENKHENRGQEKKQQKQYYDRSHRDYHNWDDREDRAYQNWQQENHENRAFSRLNRRRQSTYWTWRHEHPDSDGDRH